MSKILSYIVSYSILALPLIITGVFTFTNYNHTEAKPVDIEKVNNCLDMPLDKVTIWINVNHFEDAVEKSSWAKVGVTPFSSSIKIEPKELTLYKTNVDLTMVTKLISVAEHSGIKIDGDAIILPTKNKRVLVPTWIIYALAADNCFKEL